MSRDELLGALQALTGQQPAREDLPPVTRAGHGPLLNGGQTYISSELNKLKLVLDNFAKEAAPTVLEQSGCMAAPAEAKACLVQWATEFSTRAFRRPPRQRELDLYQQLLTGPDSVGTEEELVAALLRSVFFAPSFLYRPELGQLDLADAASAPLTGFELATRLSFLTTTAPPDATLLAAAENGSLSDADVRLAEYRRLADTELGRRAMARFVLEWLDANEPKIQNKADKYTETLSPGFETTLRQSALDTIAEVLAGQNPTVNGLLTSTAYLDDPAVLEIREAAADGSSGDAELTQRAGLLMHPYLVSSYTKEDGVSPFQIGVALRDIMLCEHVPAAPEGAAEMVNTDIPDDLSLREELVATTSSQEPCASCHSLFAPFGYAFLAFDPVGRWITNDPKGKAWDLSGSIGTFSGQTLAFNTPSELVQQFAASPQVHGCFTQAALQWTLGRQLTAEDHGFVARLNEISQQTGGDVKQVFEAIVSAPEFTRVLKAQL